MTRSQVPHPINQIKTDTKKTLQKDIEAEPTPLKSKSQEFSETLLLYLKKNRRRYVNLKFDIPIFLLNSHNKQDISLTHLLVKPKLKFFGIQLHKYRTVRSKMNLLKVS